MKLLSILIPCYVLVLQGQQPGSAIEKPPATSIDKPLATSIEKQPATSIGLTGTSIEKQRLSIRKQVHATGPAVGFFTTPWSNDGLATAVGFTPPALASAAGGDCEPMPEATLSKLILQASEREQVDTRMIRAIIRRESGSKPCAVSAKGAQGLMQIMPATQIELGVQDPFDAESNINAGVRYVKQMLDRYKGNTSLALAAYNAGPQRITPGADAKVPEIPETQAYVSGILAELSQLPPTEVK